MKHSICDVRVLSLSLLAAACSGGAALPGGEGEATAETSAAVTGACGLAQPAFCETFDAPHPVNTRSGQLDGVLWGTSRASGIANLGQGQYDAWGTTTLVDCDGSTPTVQPPGDVIICNGQLREAVNDLHDVTTLSMYPRQPFDFAGRTGIIAFDVSNDTLSSHTEWPELWMSDQPVPTPFAFEGGWLSEPRNGFGLRFSAEVAPHQGPILSSNCPDDGNARWSMGSAVVVRNYVPDDQDAGGTIKAQMVGCVTRATGPNQLNHIEVHVSQSQIDVYATDAGTTSPLKHIAVIPNANLSFTRGLVWIEDAHYNASKGNGQTEHTFAWDNVGFDGPVLPRDLGFDAPDALTVPTSGEVNVGWLAQPGTGKPFTIANVSGSANATAGLLVFDFHHYDAPTSLTYVVNGHSHTVAWPFADTRGYTWRSYAAPVPLSDVVSGTNNVNIYAADQPLVIANVDLILAGAGGTVSP